MNTLQFLNVNEDLDTAVLNNINDILPDFQTGKTLLSDNTVYDTQIVMETTPYGDEVFRKISPHFFENSGHYIYDESLLSLERYMSGKPSTYGVTITEKYDGEVCHIWKVACNGVPYHSDFGNSYFDCETSLIKLLGTKEKYMKIPLTYHGKELPYLGCYYDNDTPDTIRLKLGDQQSSIWIVSDLVTFKIDFLSNHHDYSDLFNLFYAKIYGMLKSKAINKCKSSGAYGYEQAIEFKATVDTWNFLNYSMWYSANDFTRGCFLSFGLTAIEIGIIVDSIRSYITKKIGKGCLVRYLHSNMCRPLCSSLTSCNLELLSGEMMSLNSIQVSCSDRLDISQFIFGSLVSEVYSRCSLLRWKKDCLFKLEFLMVMNSETYVKAGEFCHIRLSLVYCSSIMNDMPIVSYYIQDYLMCRATDHLFNGTFHGTSFFEVFDGALWPKCRKVEDQTITEINDYRVSAAYSRLFQSAMRYKRSIKSESVFSAIVHNIFKSEDADDNGDLGGYTTELLQDISSINGNKGISCPYILTYDSGFFLNYVRPMSWLRVFNVPQDYFHMMNSTYVDSVLKSLQDLINDHSGRLDADSLRAITRICSIGDHGPYPTSLFDMTDYENYIISSGVEEMDLVDRQYTSDDEDDYQMELSGGSANEGIDSE